MLTPEALVALIKLVQRKRNDPYFEVWHSYIFRIDRPSDFECFLCGAVYHNFPDIEEHGINHLKEHNLLPFI